MKQRILILLVFVVAAVVLFLALRHPSTGIDVTVGNRGPGTITDVTIKVEGHAFPVGQIASAGSAKARLKTMAPGQSDISVEFRDADGMWHELKAGVRLEQDYRGTVTIDLERNAIVRVEPHVGPK